MIEYDREEIDGYTVVYYYDQDADAPWASSEGHGPVRKSTQTHRRYGQGDKKPGERPLNRPDRNEYQFYYDWKEACRLSRKDVWNTEPYDAPNRVQRAVQADFDFLRGYLNDAWCYVGIVVSKGGDEVDACWGFETNQEYHRAAAREMVEGCKQAAKKAWVRKMAEARERKYWACRDVETV